MVDEAQEKIRLTKTQEVATTTDAVAQPNVIKDGDNQKRWLQTQDEHKLGKHESATHIALTSESIANLKDKGLAQKFEIVDNIQIVGKPATENLHPSYTEGLKAITQHAETPEEKEQLQGIFSIAYMQQKSQEILKSVPIEESPAGLTVASRHYSASEVVAQAQTAGDVRTDATNATNDASTKTNTVDLNNPKEFADEIANNVSKLMGDKSDVKHNQAKAEMKYAMANIENSPGSMEQKLAAEKLLFRSVQNKITAYFSSRWHNDGHDHVMAKPVEFSLPSGEILNVDVDQSAYGADRRANGIIDYALGKKGADQKNRAPHMVQVQFDSFEQDPKLTSVEKAQKERDFIWLLKTNLGANTQERNSSDNCSIKLEQPAGKSVLTLDISNTAMNGYVLLDGVVSTTDAKTGVQTTVNPKTGETTTLQKKEDGEITYQYQNSKDSSKDFALGLKADGTAWIQEAGQSKVELSNEQAAKDWRVQRAELEKLVNEKIPSERERSQFRSDMRMFQNRYPQKFLHMSVEDGHQEIAKTYQEIGRLLTGDVRRVDGKNDMLPSRKDGATPWRIQISAQVMHHTADPTSVDQGQYPVCQYESLQDREYVRKPSAVAKLVADVALYGKYSSTDRKFSVELNADTLAPDAEAKEYKVKKGNSAARSYASQLYDIVAINIALDSSRQDRKGTPLENVHLEHRAGEDGNYDYYLVQNHKNVTPAVLWSDACAGKLFGKTKVDTKIPPSVGALVDVNAAIIGHRETGFIVVGTKASKLTAIPNPSAAEKKEDLQRREYYDCGDTKGLLNLHSKTDLPQMLLDVQKNGQWPPIVAMDSNQEPVVSQWRRTYHDPDHPVPEEGGHTEVVTDISTDGKMVSVDGHWGKKGDDTGPPHVFTDAIGNAILADATELPIDTKTQKGFDSNFRTWKEFVDHQPTQWKAIKESWVNDLQNWVTSHQSDIANSNPADWQKSHPSDGMLPDYIRKHGKDDPNLERWIEAAKTLLKKYPH